MRGKNSIVINTVNPDSNDQFDGKENDAKMLFSTDIAYLLHGKYDFHLKHKNPLIVDFISINDWQKNVGWDGLHHYTWEGVLNECAVQQLDYFTVLKKSIDHTIFHNPEALFALASIVVRNIPKHISSEDTCLLMENIEMIYRQSGYGFTDQQKFTLQTMIFKTHIDRSSLTFSAIRDNKEQTLSIIESNISVLCIEYKKITHKNISFMHGFELQEEVLQHLVYYILYLSDIFPKRNFNINDITAVLQLFNQYFGTTIPLEIALDRSNYNSINHWRIV